MLVIRLARRGRKKQAFFDLVVAEKSKSATKKFIVKLGYFNPLSNEGAGQLSFDQLAVDKYLLNGAQPSQTVARLLAKNGLKSADKFIHKRTTKPKKMPTSDTPETDKEVEKS